MIRSALLSLALLSPAALSAQSFSFDGTLALGTTDIAGGSGIGVVDATVAIPLTQRYPLTFEVGAYLFALDGKRPHETYVAFAWDDTWRAGVVRPAFDQALPSVFARVAPYLAYERAEYTRAHTTVEAMRRTAVPWGVSWQQAFGQTDVAVSVHDANKGNFRSASVALTYRGAGWTLAAAVEAVTEDDFTHEGINAKLGARFDIGEIDAGITYLRPDANDTPDALALDVVVPVSSRVDLLAFGELTDKSTDDAYGLALDYKVQPDSSVLFSATDGARDSAVHMTLERRF